MELCKDNPVLFLLQAGVRAPSIFQINIFVKILLKCSSPFLECISSNFDEFVRTPAYLDLSLEELCAYLKHKNLRMKDEETVLKSVLKWCKHNQKIDDFCQLSNHVQFDLISVRTLCAILKDDEIFKSSRSATNLILEKMQKIANPLVISRPRFSSHAFVAIPYKSKIFFCITFYGKDSIDFKP